MMDMSVVAASKLFKTSPRQREILGKANFVTSSGALTVQEPQQLYVKVNEDHKDERVVGPVSDNNSVSDEFDKKEKERVVVSPRTEQSRDDAQDVRLVQDEREDVLKSTSTDKEGVQDEKSTDEKEVTSSTVSASSLPRTDVTDNMSLEVKGIKGTLNSIESTCGVSRVSVKDDKEVWIHYNDNVNLNDVMVDVIEYMNKYGYTYLEFNRLARSENAVVFVIIKSDTTRGKEADS